VAHTLPILEFIGASGSGNTVPLESVVAPLSGRASVAGERRRD
jgi:hypothetical protein